MNKQYHLIIEAIQQGKVFLAPAWYLDKDGKSHITETSLTLSHADPFAGPVKIIKESLDKDD